MLTKTFINLTNDVLFKYIFSHEELAKDLLNAVFDYIGIPKKIKKVEVFKDYPMYGKNLEDKIFYGDIVAILDTGEIVSVEMYTKFGKEEYLKSASYTSRLFANQLKKGEIYTNAKKVYCINFILGDYANENHEIVNEYGFVRKIKHPNLNNEFINMFLVRLDLIKKIIYNINEKRLIRWGKFMISENMEEMQNIAKGDEKLDQTIAYVKDFLEKNGTTFRDKLIYEKNVSHEEGYDEGKKEKSIETAKSMLKDKCEISTIMKYTNLTKEQIEALQ